MKLASKVVDIRGCWEHVDYLPDGCQEVCKASHSEEDDSEVERVAGEAEETDVLRVVLVDLRIGQVSELYE